MTEPELIRQPGTLLTADWKQALEDLEQLGFIRVLAIDPPFAHVERLRAVEELPLAKVALEVTENEEIIMPNEEHTNTIIEALTGARGLSARDVAAKAGLTEYTAKKWLEELLSAGKVTKTGATSSSRWWLAGEETKAEEKAEPVKRVKPKAAPKPKREPKKRASAPVLGDLLVATGVSSRFTLRYSGAEIDCASATDVAELLHALRGAA